MIQALLEPKQLSGLGSIGWDDRTFSKLHCRATGEAFLVAVLFNSFLELFVKLSSSANVTLDIVNEQFLARATCGLEATITVADRISDVVLLVLDMATRVNKLPTGFAGAIYTISGAVSYGIDKHTKVHTLAIWCIRLALSYSTQAVHRQGYASRISRLESALRSTVGERGSRYWWR